LIDLLTLTLGFSPFLYASFPDLFKLPTVTNIQNRPCAIHALGPVKGPSLPISVCLFLLLQVTILFADVVSFTSMCQQIPAHAVMVRGARLTLEAG
jgi:hypothetical protein